MKLNKNKQIHFVGISGSGNSAIAGLIYEMGYKISGCDLDIDNPYIEKLKKKKTMIFTGQSVSHLENADLVVVTPSILFSNAKNQEIVKAKKERKLMTWQEFLGKYFQNDTNVICIAGTHGKSTTTAITGLVLEKSGKDPSVVVGGNIKEWKANYRYGRGKYLLIEADEFYDNYLLKCYFFHIFYLIFIYIL